MNLKISKFKFDICFDKTIRFTFKSYEICLKTEKPTFYMKIIPFYKKYVLVLYNYRKNILLF